jgi:hypothetical protein
MNQDLKDEEKDDWVVPITAETYTVANLVSEGMSMKRYIELAVCVMAVEQLDRISKRGIIIPPNVIEAVNKLTGKVKKK